MTKTKITAATTDAQFVASDAALRQVEADYQAFENDYARRLANIEQDFPGYHAYYQQIDPLGHDPYVLAAMCSAVKPDFQPNDLAIVKLMDELHRPRRQYTLTIIKQLAPDYAERYDGVDVEAVDRRYVDLHVRFVNYDLYCTVDSVLTHDQLAAYAGYLRSHGGRPDLFPVSDYPQASVLRPLSDYRASSGQRQRYPLLNSQLAIGEPLIGYPYVWGGTDLETGFDCSGFVDYIMDELGYHFRNQIRGVARRLPVAGSTIGGQFYPGIYDVCQPVNQGDEQPGDLVFFGGTFDASYRSANLTHVGVYVGDDHFLACSAPDGIRYQSYDDRDEKGRPWRQLLACYRRLPKLPAETNTGKSKYGQSA